MGYERNGNIRNNRGNHIPPVSKKRKTEEVQKIKDELHSFARTKWGQRWINALLEIGRPFRMQRGIIYAKEDRISHFTLSPGSIFATVQGTAPTPYRVKILFEPFTSVQWLSILTNISEKAKYIIELLENRLPLSLIDVFSELNLSLFPKAHEVTASCTCPDKAIPCKHIAAMILYMALVVDFDPFLLLKIRGMEKVGVLKFIKDNRSCCNQPITHSFKKLRNTMHHYDSQFSVPNIPAENLDRNQFTQGKDFNIGFDFSNPSKTIETLNTIGVAPNLESPEIFGKALTTVYRQIMKKSFLMAKKMEEKQ